MLQKGSLYFFTGSFSNKQTTSVYKQDLDLAKEAQIQADFRSIQTALENYRINKGSYPDNLNQLVQASFFSGSYKNLYTQKNYDYQSNGKSLCLTTKLGDGRDYTITD